MGANCFTAEQYNKLVEILKNHMETRFTNEKQRQEKRKDIDYDEEVEEALEEEVGYTLNYGCLYLSRYRT